MPESPTTLLRAYVPDLNSFVQRLNEEQVAEAAWSRVVRGVTFAAIATGGVLACAFIVPIDPVISANNFGIRNNGDLREEIGFTDLVAAVAKVRDSLTPAERSNFAIITGNYGETGAIDLYGRLIVCRRLSAGRTLPGFGATAIRRR